MRRITLAALCDRGADRVRAVGALDADLADDPRPPSAALVPCVPTPQHRQKEGGASAADDGATIRDGKFDLTACQAKRLLLVEAWPHR